MQNQLRRIAPIFCFLLLGLSQLHSLEAKPFRRALILAGGGLAPITYASIGKHLEAYGWKPDVIIATCGSSLSVNALMAHPHQGALKTFLTSRDFHGFMRTPEISLSSVFDIQKLIRPVTEELNESMFSKFIMGIPHQISMPKAPSKFPSTGTRYIIVAGKALFGPGENYSALPIRYRETYFTDPNTARLLEGRPSAIARQFPRSYLDPYVEVQTNANPVEAARASISDPVLINPGRVRGDYYLTGGVNLYPIELARDLADEVVVTYPLKFPQYMSDIVENTFGYKALDRQAYVASQTDLNWVDVYGKNSGFNPQVILFKIYPGVPKNYYNFKEVAELEWEFGKERAGEAVQSLRNGKGSAHLRRVFSKQKSSRVEENFKNKARVKFHR